MNNKEFKKIYTQVRKFPKIICILGKVITFVLINLLQKNIIDIFKSSKK